MCYIQLGIIQKEKQANKGKYSGGEEKCLFKTVKEDNT